MWRGGRQHFRMPEVLTFLCCSEVLNSISWPLAVSLSDHRFSAYFGGNSLTSQIARTIRRSSRLDSKIPQACPAGFLCFEASQSETDFFGHAVCRFNNPMRKRGTDVIHSLTRRVVISTLISRTTLNQQPASSTVLISTPMAFGRG